MPSTGSPPPPSDRAAAGVRSPAFRLGLGVAGFTLLLDQLSKWWILAAVMQPPRTIEITSFFNIVLVWNRGVSFGLFNQPGGWNAVVLSILALAVVVVLLVWMARTHHRLTALALGLIVGGAIGNVIDRLRFGAVVDFLDVHYAGWHWPAFNVADSGISMGAALLIAEALFFRARSS